MLAMEKLVCAIVAFAFGTSLFGQNLVPNPSFEEYTYCPDAEGQIDSVVGWQTCRGSCDYYNTCAVPHLFGVPNNIVGHQIPVSGNGYAGVICYSTNVQDTIALREWIGISLLEPMEIGALYYASVRISWTTNEDTIIGSLRYASNKFGFRFSTQPYITYDFQNVLNNAHIYSNEIVTDSIGWTLISGSFVADSAYTFLSLGNFFGDLSTDRVLLNPTGSNDGSYYYVDDVCVSPVQGQCPLAAGLGPWLGAASVTIPTVFTDRIILIGPKAMIGSVHLFAVDGKAVPTRTEWTDDGAVLYVGSVADGVYVIALMADPSHTQRTRLLHLGNQ